MNIVLYQPQIPPNTGNIARTCACTGATLHLIKPLGFSTDTKSLRRAGLDYWHLLDIHYYNSFEELLNKYEEHNFYFATKFANSFYTEVEYSRNDFLVFGNETSGLPAQLINTYQDNTIRIPMLAEARALNLANAVNIILYEALRQLNFIDLV